ATTHVHPFHRTPQREFCLSGMELPVCRENPYRGPAGSGTFPLGRRHEGARMDGRGSGAKSRAGSFAYAVDEDGAGRPVDDGPGGARASGFRAPAPDDDDEVGAPFPGRPDDLFARLAGGDLEPQLELLGDAAELADAFQEFGR